MPVAMTSHFAGVGSVSRSSIDAKLLACRCRRPASATFAASRAVSTSCRSMSRPFYARSRRPQSGKAHSFDVQVRGSARFQDVARRGPSNAVHGAASSHGRVAKPLSPSAPAIAASGSTPRHGGACPADAAPHDAGESSCAQHEVARREQAADNRSYQEPHGSPEGVRGGREAHPQSLASVAGAALGGAGEALLGDLHVALRRGQARTATPGGSGNVHVTHEIRRTASKRYGYPAYAYPIRVDRVERRRDSRSGRSARAHWLHRRDVVRSVVRHRHLEGETRAALIALVAAGVARVKVETGNDADRSKQDLKPQHAFGPHTRRSSTTLTGGAPWL